MGSFSDTVENAILDKMFGRTAWADVTIWVGLSTEDPSDSGSNIAEPTAASYGRQEASTSAWCDATAGEIDNVAAIEFTTAVQSWCTISYVTFHDASTSGNMLGWAALNTARDVTVGDALRFPVGGLVITQD